jgi:hypothetical protein
MGLLQHLRRVGSQASSRGGWLVQHMESWTAREATHTCTKGKMQQIVINLHGSKIIEAKTKAKIN